jgi:hypothetical protein
VAADTNGNAIDDQRSPPAQSASKTDGRNAQAGLAVPKFAGESPIARNRPTRRGVLKVRVYDTPLDLQLDVLTILGGSFKLEGFGVRYVGKMSQNWQAQLGKPIAIERRSTAFGDSEMDLPMIGKVGVVGGTMLLENIVDQDAPRVRGHIAFTLPGPNGPASFTGEFEVDVVFK